MNRLAPLGRDDLSGQELLAAGANYVVTRPAEIPGLIEALA